MNKLISFTLLFLILGCVSVKSIAEVKNDDLLGEQVSVRGTVLSRVSIGDISGYVLQDSNNDTISVSSEALPAVGDVITVTGRLDKTILIGYFIVKE